MSDPIIIEENKKLDEILGKVRKAKVDLDKIMEDIGAVNIKRLKQLREDPMTEPTDFIQFMELMERESANFDVKGKYKKMEELTYLSKEPYFSRINLKEGDDEKSFYIGKFGYTEGEPVIIDWRAKVASVYYKYRYPQKNVKYDTPNGVETKDLTLKRTFEIDDGKLVKYYNNDIQLDENELIVDKIQDRTGGVLEDIVETIQADQHEIIESDPRNICIVQGTVGSGKSTVAIHKLSYIFFNYPDLVNPERAILIAKNQILVGYLSTLFPKLGIFDIGYGTLRDVLYRFMFTERSKFKFNLDKNVEVSEFTIEDVASLKERVAKVHQKYKKEIDAIFDKDEFAVFSGFVYDPSSSVLDNIEEAIEDLEEELALQKDILKQHPKHRKADLFKENIKVLKKIIKKLISLRGKVKNNDLQDLIREMDLIENGEMGYLQTLIYAFIHSEVLGVKKYHKFEYCVVDEGQDLGILEYFILGKLVKNNRFCILGDLNQSYTESGLTGWEEIYQVVEGAGHAKTFELDTNYRSTKPIISLANSILAPYTDKYLPKSIDRIGDDPVIETFNTNNDVMSAFEKELKKDLENQEKSIGIICMDEGFYENSEKILDSLKLPEDKLIKLREKEKIEYSPRAVYLTHFNNAKGLEFGKVYILGLNLSKVRTFKEAKRAFVAVTRAMNELAVYGTN